MPSLHFKGKVLVQNHHLAVPFHELVPVKAKGLSATPSLHDNVIVHGDNLATLKALLPTYHGKVKCIYIDPPYKRQRKKGPTCTTVSSIPKRGSGSIHKKRRVGSVRKRAWKPR